MGSNVATSLELSSDAIPAEMRAEAIGEFWRNGVLGFDFASAGNQPLKMQSSIMLMDDMQVGISEFGGFRVDRTKSAIAKDGKGDFALNIVESGACLFRQRGQDIPVAAGMATLGSYGEPVSLDCPDPVRLTLFQVSREALLARVPDAEDAVRNPIPAAMPAIQLMLAYAREARIGGLLKNGQGPDLARNHLLDLMALAITSSGDAAERARLGALPAARLAAIKQDIGERLDDRDLSIGAVAARAGVSARYVAKLFAAEDTGFADHVREQRLNRLRADLADPANAATGIADIAYTAGFGDLSYFNRSFRNAFGMTPGEYRNRTKQGR